MCWTAWTNARRLASQFRFEIANGQPEMQNADDTWPFRNSAGIKRKINFIVYSSHLCCFDGHATNDLDLGSDHCAVYAGFTSAARVRGKRHRKQIKKRWKPLESNDGSPSLYNQVLTAELRSRNPTNLCDLEKVIVQAKNSAMTNNNEHKVKPNSRGSTLKYSC